MRTPMNSDVAKAVSLAESAKQSNPKWWNFFQIMYDFLTRALYNIYCWDNLPDSMDSRFLEMCLMQDGVAGLLDHPMYGPINTRATWGSIGIYGVPVVSTFYSMNDEISMEIDVSKDSENGVLVMNNATGTGYAMYAFSYAQRLADIMVTHSVNIDAQKTPVLLDGTFEQLEQVMKAYMQYVGGSPFIPSRVSAVKKKDAIAGDQLPLKVLKTDAPFIADTLYTQFVSVLHEFYALVGINYANTTKRERMIVDEVNSNKQEILLSGMAGLNTRREAADQYNNIHGTDIKVHISVDPVGMKPHNFEEMYMQGNVEVGSETDISVEKVGE